VLTADIAPAGRGVRTAEATRAVLEQLEADCYVAELRD
jgi:3-isopropylmalate dehydrogenase